jgi:hypothetical protein
MDRVVSTVRSSYVRSLALRPGHGRGVNLRSRLGLGRVANCARFQGSGESLLALEARARASR